MGPHALGSHPLSHTVTAGTLHVSLAALLVAMREDMD